MQNPKGADASADLYSLGMTAVLAVYGKVLPIDVLTDTASFHRELSCETDLKRVLGRAVARRAEERFDSVESFCRELKKAGLGESVRGESEKITVPQVRRLIPRRLTPWIVASPFVLFVVILIAVVVWNVTQAFRWGALLQEGAELPGHCKAIEEKLGVEFVYVPGGEFVQG